MNTDLNLAMRTNNIFSSKTQYQCKKTIKQTFLIDMKFRNFDPSVEMSNTVVFPVSHLKILLNNCL